MKRIKIQMVRMNVKKGEAEFEKEIALTESYFFKCFEIFMEKKIKNDELVDGIIKVVLSEENGLNELKDGITYKGEKYIEINTTTAGMKLEETNEFNEEFKVESIFINKEKYGDFIKEFEQSLSGGIISEIEKEKREVCINKMFTSKKALGMTGAEYVAGMPNICFVDEFEYVVKNNRYSYIDENNNIKTGKIKMPFVLNDGGGLMTPNYAIKIKEALGKSYDIEFVIFRMYHGLSGKGVLVTFDFATYMKKQYKKDTKTFKKIKDKYYLKDYFGNWRDIDNVDCIMNKSQAKYLGEWKDKIPTGSRWEEILYPIYKDSKYNDINKGIYISKINKDPKKLKGKIRLNYQVLQNLNISAQDLIDIAKETVEEFKNAIKMDDINYVKLALGDWVTDIDKSATITNKLNLIIDRVGEETLDWKYIRKELKKHLTKRLNQLSAGKITVNGEICVGALCPITYCNYLISGNRGNNGLQKGQFYQGGNVGKRLSYRNPIAYYAEITEINLVKNELLKVYSSEILFINAFSDFLFIKSGADVDGDLFGVVDNEILINNIIKEEAPFVNLNDGKTIPHEFTRNQAYEDLWESAGNLIGEIAVKNSRLCAEMTSYSTLVNKDKKVTSYTWYKEDWLKKNGRITDLYEFKKKKNYFKSENEFYWYNDDPEYTWEECKADIKRAWNKYKNESTEIFNKFLEENDIKYISDFSIEEQKQLREKMFKKFKNDFFKILLASQLAIDKPKTLTPIPKWLEKELYNYDDLYKPRFMHNLGKCSCKGKGNIKECKDIINKVSNNVMDEYCYYIYKEVLKPLIDLSIGDYKPNKVFINKILNPVKTEINEDLVRIYKENSTARSENIGNTSELNKADIKTREDLDNLGLLDSNTVAYTLRQLNATIRFNFNFMFEDYFLPKLKEMESKTDTLIEIKKNTSVNLKRATKMKISIKKVNVYYWGGKKYIAIKKEKVIDIKSDREEILKKLVKEGLVKRVRFFGGDYTKEIPRVINVKELKSEIGSMYSGEKDVTLEDGEYVVNDNYKIDKSGKGITVWVKVS